MSILIQLQSEILPVINQALRKFVDSIFPDRKSELSQIFFYHLGLQDQGSDQGKRIRPFLVALCANGAGCEWQKAIPAAVALEILHNFSLIHDDIEDNGDIRRGRPAVWTRWGLAKGLNAGDAMFAAGFEALVALSKDFSSELVLEAMRLFSATSLKLTEGQQMDIDFETRQEISIEEYFHMISGKTAALLAACCQMGALLAGRNTDTQQAYHQFGHNLGMAFQIYDDWLGIWGNQQETGKSTSGDLVEGKKTLPVLIGLQRSQRFSDRWKARAVRHDETGLLAQWLREDGVETAVKTSFQEWSGRTQYALADLDCEVETKTALAELVQSLIERKK